MKASTFIHAKIQKEDAQAVQPQASKRPASTVPKRQDQLWRQEIIRNATIKGPAPQQER